MCHVYNFSFADLPFLLSENICVRYLHVFFYKFYLFFFDLRLPDHVCHVVVNSVIEYFIFDNKVCLFLRNTAAYAALAVWSVGN